MDKQGFVISLSLIIFSSLIGYLLTDSMTDRSTDTMRPVHYEILLMPDIYGKKPPKIAHGRVKIDFECLVATNHLSLHAHHLEIRKSSVQITPQLDEVVSVFLGAKQHRYRSSLKRQGKHNSSRSYGMQLDETSSSEGKTLKWTQINYVEENETIAIYTEKDFIEGGVYRVLIDYTARVTPAHDGRGLYWSEVKGHTNRYMIASHFSPTHARRAFPCFDEPRFKATFTLKLWRKTGVVSLSNMQLNKSYKDSGGWTVDVFDLTPPMSTYLLAVVVTHMTSTCSQHGEVTLCLWCMIPEQDAADHMLHSASTFLTYFEDLTGIPYMLPKLDLVVIPHTRVQATEQWGLITFRESSVFYDLQEDTCDTYVSKLASLAHEISHTWFGDLVTPHTWQDLWLKEGMATYFMHKALSSLHPQWDHGQLYLSKVLLPALTMDSSFNGQAVVTDKSALDPEDAFTYATSSKAAALIEMLENIEGEKVLYECIRNYLTEFSYSTASSKDFTELCSETYMRRSRPVNITSILEPWLYNTGYPMVSILKNKSENTVKILQNLFVADKNEELMFPRDQLWSFQVCFFSMNKTECDSSEDNYLISSKQANLPVQDINNDFTVKHYGFYRIAYSERYLDNVFIKYSSGKMGKLSVKERAQLLDDIFVGAQDGRISAVLPLTMSEYLDTEEEYLPWDVFIKHIAYYTAVLYGSPSYNLIMNFIGSLLYEHFAKINWDALNQLQHKNDEDILKSMWSYNIIWTACEIDYKPCVEKAVQFFRAFKVANDVHYIKPDMRYTVFCKGIQEGNVTDWEFLYSLLERVEAKQYRLDVLQALAFSKEEWILQRYLNIVLTNPNIDSIEMLHTFSALILNPTGERLVWEHLRDYWHFTPLGIYKGSILLFLAGRLNTESQMREIQHFVETTFDFIFKDIINMAIETTKKNLQWLENNKESIDLWLNKISQASSYSSYKTGNCAAVLYGRVVLMAGMLIYQLAMS